MLWVRVLAIHGCIRVGTYDITFEVLHRWHNRKLTIPIFIRHLSHPLFVSEHLESLPFLLSLVLVLHEAVELLLVVVLQSVHASCHSLFLDARLLLLFTLVLHWTIARWMRLTMTEGTEDGRAVAEQFFGAVLELMAWLPAALTPNAP